MPFLRSLMPFKPFPLSSMDIFSTTFLKSIYVANKKVLVPYGVNTVQHKDSKSLVLSRLLRGHCIWSRPTRLTHARFIYIVFQIIPQYKISVNNLYFINIYPIQYTSGDTESLRVYNK